MTRKYLLNEDFFDEFNERSCYWAGFIAADGGIDKNNRRLVFCLNYKDISHLEKLCRDICYTKSPILYKRKKKYSDKIYYEARLAINSVKICKSLYKNFNIYPNKTLTYKPPQLPRNLVHHFYRGYSDGDGSFCILKASNKLYYKVMGTYELILDFKNTIRKNTSIPDNKILKQGKIFNLRYGANSAIRVGDVLYKNSSVKMNRKYDIWRKFK